MRLQHYAVVAWSPELVSQFALCARRGDQGACARTDLERELLSVDREEAKLVKEIKSAAAKGNESSARVLAKSLVRLRGQKAKLHAGILQMRGVRSAIAVRATAVIGAPSRPCPACSQACGFTTVSDIANTLIYRILVLFIRCNRARNRAGCPSGVKCEGLFSCCTHPKSARGTYYGAEPACNPARKCTPPRPCAPWAMLGRLWRR